MQNPGNDRAAFCVFMSSSPHFLEKCLMRRRKQNILLNLLLGTRGKRHLRAVKVTPRIEHHGRRPALTRVSSLRVKVNNGKLYLVRMSFSNVLRAAFVMAISFLSLLRVSTPLNTSRRFIG